LRQPDELFPIGGATPIQTPGESLRKIVFMHTRAERRRLKFGES
jgi:hypothetical protein